MSNYVIGDLQGCFNEFKFLLDKISFDAHKDKLWLCGDLVNRGDDSLACLKFIHSIRKSCHVVLGNHDLHLLAIAEGIKTLNKSDTIEDILKSPDCFELLQWIKTLPFHFLKKVTTSKGEIEFVMTHAGIPPSWTKNDLIENSIELSQLLSGKESTNFLKNMYGNKPNHPRDCETREDRLRLNINYFTRMRFMHSDGSLNLEFKGKINEAVEDLQPWFKFKSNLVNDRTHILFGHWAALEGVTGIANISALDTGCVWGNKLTAMRLEDYQLFSCDKLN